jgi:hypothetical protein
MYKKFKKNILGLNLKAHNFIEIENIFNLDIFNEIF